MATASGVRRRRDFYIPGFDPIHPRLYRELYRSEGAAQARLSGHLLPLILAASDGDEVLVGHSSGTHCAVAILADLDCAGVAAGGPALSLLT